MSMNERDATRLSLFMASLVSSPGQANRFFDLARKNTDDGAFAGIINELAAEIGASAGQSQPSISTLKKAVESLVAKKEEPARTAGRLLAAALEHR
jgi:hypothetical protein